MTRVIYRKVSQVSQSCFCANSPVTHSPKEIVFQKIIPQLTKPQIKSRGIELSAKFV